MELAEQAPASVAAMTVIEQPEAPQKQQQTNVRRLPMIDESWRHRRFSSLMKHDLFPERAPTR
jgi:hypothetical protein